MKASGIDPSVATIAYCDSGHYSTGLWFLMHEIMGNKQASNSIRWLHARMDQTEKAYRSTIILETSVGSKKSVTAQITLEIRQIFYTLRAQIT